MTEKTHAVPNGVIHYWMNDFQQGRAVLVFLPGLTADHRLFDKQVEAFESTYNLLAWDAPGHGKSRPFVMDFTLAQKAAWLHAILQAQAGAALGLGVLNDGVHLRFGKPKHTQDSHLDLQH